jgi:hypothetical protein
MISGGTVSLTGPGVGSVANRLKSLKMSLQVSVVASSEAGFA